MKKFIAAGLTVAALAVPALAGAQEVVQDPEPYLGSRAAATGMKKALAPKFSSPAYRLSVYDFKCSRTRAANVRSCKSYPFGAGDSWSRARGRVVAHQDRDFESLLWLKVRWQVRQTDYYCKHVQGTKYSTGRDCVKTKRGRARIAY